MTLDKDGHVHYMQKALMWAMLLGALAARSHIQ